MRRRDQVLIPLPPPLPPNQSDDGKYLYHLDADDDIKVCRFVVGDFIRCQIGPRSFANPPTPSTTSHPPPPPLSSYFLRPQCLVFSPNRYWLCAATEDCIKIWDLESKSIVDELRPEVSTTGKRSKAPACISLAWSTDGNTLFAGYTDGIIRVYQIAM